MKALKQFPVFGEAVEVMATTKATGGSFAMLVQTSPPGGGPPPHVHANEDEIFQVLEGEYEMFDGERWNKVPKGEHVYTLRGQVHTFRNCGRTDGKMLCIATPGGLDEYLEEISVLQVPQDMERLMAISERYGIRFITPEPPIAAPV
ncbi:MAG TPA: cupin domain-containing protein [Acidobacteriaceae bacterium]|jgi:mannose-6-phosphate isomerase-like protein (cupin superfamily)|nr:cupin domain-containing protein [Acidobacteriaceae bacterium]